MACFASLLGLSSIRRYKTLPVASCCCTSDAVSTRLTCIFVLATNTLTPPGQPLTVVYHVVAGGKAIRVQRSVEVVAGNPATTQAPTLTPVPLNAGDHDAVTGDGTHLGLMTSVLVGTAYMDPGVTAFDDADGDLTAQVVTCGAADLDTSHPTPVGQPYMITYQVADLDGNMAATVYRFVEVSCPSTTTICPPQAGTTQPTCSYAGVCNLPSTDFSSTIQQLTQPSSANSTATMPDPRVWSAPPSLVLIGPTVLTIDASSRYDPCTPSSVSSLSCEPGVIATYSPPQGDTLFNVTNKVVACREHATVSEPQPYSVVGLEYCQFKGGKAAPGVHIITFSLAYGGPGLLASVSRLLLVQEQCSRGEYACPGTGRCSFNRVCDPSIHKIDTNAAAGAPPSMVLLTTPTIGQVVTLQYGQTYAPCAAGRMPTATAPCEPGVVALDATGVDITARVLVCPPPGCAGGAACPSSRLAVVSNISAVCGVPVTQPAPAQAGYNTSLNAVMQWSFPEVITSVRFVVYDALGGQAEVTRIVHMVGPCGAGRYQCNVTCSSSPCDTATAQGIHHMLSGDAQGGNRPPVITSLLPTPESLSTSDALLPVIQDADADVTFWLPFGTVGLLPAIPCTAQRTNASSSGCGIVATDTEDGDVSSSVMLEDISPCQPMWGNLTLPDSVCHCSAAGLWAGQCAPGKYTLRYSVTDSQGVAAAPMVVRVYIERMIAYSLDVVAGAASADQAAAMASLLLDSGAPGAAAALALGQQLARTLLPALPLGDLRHVLVASAHPATWQPTIINTTATLTNSTLSNSTAPNTRPTPISNSSTSSNVTAPTTPPSPISTGPTSSNSTTDGGGWPVLYLSLKFVVRDITPGSQDQLERWAEQVPGAVPESEQGNGPTVTHRRLTGSAGYKELQSPPASGQKRWGGRSGLAESVAQTVEMARALSRVRVPQPAADLASVGVHAAKRVLQRGLQNSNGTDATPAPVPPSPGTTNTGNGSSTLNATQAATNTTGQGATPCGEYQPRTLVLRPPDNTTLAMDIPGLGNLTDLLSLPASRLLVPTCLTREVTLDDLIAADAMQQAAALQVAVMQLMEDILTMETRQWPQQDVTDILDVTDAGYGQAIMDYLSDAQDTRASTMHRLDDLALAVNLDLSSQNSFLDSASALATTELGYLIATLSLSSVQATFLNTELVLEGLGLAAHIQYPPDVQAHIDCLYARVFGSTTYSFTTNTASGPRAISAPPPDAGGLPEDSASESSPDTGDGTVDAPPPGGDYGTIDSTSSTRSLLMSGGGAGGGRGSSGSWEDSQDVDPMDLQDWTGYAVLKNQDVQYDLSQTKDITRRRVIGVGTGNNLLGGMLLHQTRRAASVSTCASKYRYLSTGCMDSNSGTITRSSRDESKSNVAPMGQDPVFDVQSQLFNADLNLADWYNTSEGSQEVSRAGVPFGFFHMPLPGREAGYPVWLPNEMSMNRAVQMAVYLQDAGYLSSELTSTLSLQGVVYNPQLSVFGLLDVEMTWAPTGVIDMNVLATAIPAMMYQGHIDTENWRQFVPTLLLALTMLVYVPLIAMDVYIQLKAKHQVWKESEGAAEQSMRVHGKGREPAETPAVGDSSAQLLFRDSSAQLMLRDSSAQLGDRAGAGYYPADSFTSGSPQAWERPSSSSWSIPASPPALDHHATPSGSPTWDALHASARPMPFSPTSARASLTALGRVGPETEEAAAAAAARAVDRAVQRRLGAGRRVKSLSWLAYEAIHCAIMLAALVLLFIYVFKLTMRVRLNDSFDVYDAASYAPARYLLQARDETVTDIPVSALVSQTGSLGLTLRPAPAPGSPDRWQVPPAGASALDDVAAMVQDVQTMWAIFAWYTFLQAIVMLMLVLRLISLATVQPRLRIIARTLGAALPDLLHLILGPLMITVVMLGAALCIVFYEYEVAHTAPEDISTMGGAALVMGKLIIDSDDSKALLNAVLQQAVATGNSAEVAVAGVLYGLSVIWVLYVLSIIIMTILLLIYRKLRKEMRNPPTVWEDTLIRLIWQIQVIKDRAPSNAHLVAQLAIINRRARRRPPSRALRSLAAFKTTIRSFAHHQPPPDTHRPSGPGPNGATDAIAATAASDRDLNTGRASFSGSVVGFYRPEGVAGAGGDGGGFAGRAAAAAAGGGVLSEQQGRVSGWSMPRCVRESGDGGDGLPVDVTAVRLERRASGGRIEAAAAAALRSLEMGPLQAHDSEDAWESARRWRQTNVIYEEDEDEGLEEASRGGSMERDEEGAYTGRSPPSGPQPPPSIRASATSLGANKDSDRHVETQAPLPVKRALRGFGVSVGAVVSRLWAPAPPKQSLRMLDGSGVTAGDLMHAMEVLQGHQQSLHGRPPAQETTSTQADLPARARGAHQNSAPDLPGSSLGRSVQGAWFKFGPAGPVSSRAAGQPPGVPMQRSEVERVAQAVMARLPHATSALNLSQKDSSADGKGGAQRKKVLLHVGQQAQVQAMEARERLQRRQQLLAKAQLASWLMGSTRSSTTQAGPASNRSSILSTEALQALLLRSGTLSPQRSSMSMRRMAAAAPLLPPTPTAYTPLPALLAPATAADLLVPNRLPRLTTNDAYDNASLPGVGEVAPGTVGTLSVSDGAAQTSARASSPRGAARQSLVLQVKDGIVTLAPSPTTIGGLFDGTDAEARQGDGRPLAGLHGQLQGLGEELGGLQLPPAGGSRSSQQLMVPDRSSSQQQMPVLRTSQPQQHLRSSTSGQHLRVSTSGPSIPVPDRSSISGRQQLGQSISGSLPDLDGGRTSRTSRPYVGQLHQLLSSGSRLSAPAAARAVAAAAGGTRLRSIGTMRAMSASSRRSANMQVPSAVNPLAMLALTDEERKELRVMMREEVARKHVQEWQMDGGLGFYDSVRQQRQQEARAVPTGRSFKLTASGKLGTAASPAALAAKAQLPDSTTAGRGVGAGADDGDVGRSYVSQAGGDNEVHADVAVDRATPSRLSFWSRPVLRSSQRTSDPVATATQRGGAWETIAAILRPMMHLSARDAFEPSTAAASDRSSAGTAAAASKRHSPAESNTVMTAEQPLVIVTSGDATAGAQAGCVAPGGISPFTGYPDPGPQDSTVPSPVEHGPALVPRVDTDFRPHTVERPQQQAQRQSGQLQLPDSVLAAVMEGLPPAPPRPQRVLRQTGSLQLPPREGAQHRLRQSTSLRLPDPGPAAGSVTMQDMHKTASLQPPSLAAQGSMPGADMLRLPPRESHGGLARLRQAQRDLRTSGSLQLDDMPLVAQPAHPEHPPTTQSDGSAPAMAAAGPWGAPGGRMRWGGEQGGPQGSSLVAASTSGLVPARPHPHRQPAVLTLGIGPEDDSDSIPLASEYLSSQASQSSTHGNHPTAAISQHPAMHQPAPSSNQPDHGPSAREHAPVALQQHLPPHPPRPHREQARLIGPEEEGEQEDVSASPFLPMFSPPRAGRQGPSVQLPDAAHPAAQSDSRSEIQPVPEDMPRTVGTDTQAGGQVTKQAVLRATLQLLDQSEALVREMKVMQEGLGQLTLNLPLRAPKAQGHPSATGLIGTEVVEDASHTEGTA